MPNYSIVSNAVFQPFSYQELAAPLDRQELYHEKLAEEYDKLSSQADILEAMGANDRDKTSGTYSRYKAYSDALRQEADNLYANGLNSESRQRLSDLRRRYNQEIIPIQNAWNKREQEADMQMKASLQNPSLMFTRDARTSTLDDYIKNPTGGFGVVNGANITAQMSTMAKNLEKQIRSGKKEGIDDYTYNYITQYGLDENIIRNWRDSPVLTKMFEQVMKANGVTPEALQGSMNAQDIIDKSTGYAEMGMWNAMGEDKSQMVDNYYNRAMLNYDLDIRKEREKAAIAAEAAGGGGDEDLFSVQQGTLPIATADKNIDNVVADSAKAFGWKRDDKSRTGYTPGRVSIKSGEMGGGTRFSYIPDVQVSIFDNNGRVRRWNDFREEAIKNANAAFKNRYNETMSNDERTRFINQVKKQFTQAVGTARNLGLDTKKGYTSQDLVNALNKQKASGAAGYINGYNWNHKNSDWNSTAQNINVREIKKVDHNGKFTFDSKQHTLSELLDTSSDAKINKAKGEVHAFITGMDGQEGVIFTVGKRQFFAHRDALANSNRYGGIAFDLIKQANANAKKAERLKTSDPNEAYTLEREAAYQTQQAISMLDAGFSMINASPTQKTVDIPTAKQNNAE